MEAFCTSDLRFVKGPPEEIEIECPICLLVMLDDPHLVSCCGHHFCGPCIKKFKDDNQPCPCCKEKEFQAVPDKERLQYIDGLQVKCANEECGWKKKLKYLPFHINRKRRRGECQFEVVECQYMKCEVKQKRQYMNIHENDECDQRPYDCQYCRHKGTYKYITQQHYLQCRYPVPCPNECRSDGKFPRGDIEDHLSTVCPLQPVECEFKWAGCDYSPLRKDLPQHNIESQLNHMSLLAKSCWELKKENEELKQQLAHHAMVGDHHPLLPITVSRNDRSKGVRYFYSKPCGHLMSVEVEFSCNIIIKVYKGKFHNSQLPLVSEIVIKCKGINGTTTTRRTITRGNCCSYKDTFDIMSDVIQEFKFKRIIFYTFDIVSIK